MSLPPSGQAFPSTSWVDAARASPIMMRKEEEEVSGNSSQVCPEEAFRAQSVVDLSFSGLHRNEVSRTTFTGSYIGTTVRGDLHSAAS